MCNETVGLSALVLQAHPDRCCMIYSLQNLKSHGAFRLRSIKGHGNNHHLYILQLICEDQALK
ncbi:hypothetical protein M758_1G281700 [Ceratodon purpureus]|nr:hypothetical protein M758_1G281700 [Ceratodon purpureus]